MGKMNKEFENTLLNWPLTIINDFDIAIVVDEKPSRSSEVIHRALKKGILSQLRRGVYLIGKPYRKTSPSNFQIAHSIYGPGYISFESALLYHLDS